MKSVGENTLYGLDQDVLKHILTVFESFTEIEKVVLYGSRAKGNYRPGSDIDLTFKGKVTLQILNAVANKLDDLLLPYQFDLSIHSKIDSDSLLEHIERVGIVIYPKKP
ncbi:nucleotidyltransferase domain-containing protein [soil metagenome]